MAPTQSFNCIISPFDKFWDLSQKADQERWLVASKAASVHVRFDVSVATAEQFLELLKDKSEYFRWEIWWKSEKNCSQIWPHQTDPLKGQLFAKKGVK